jgi:hypothetical protein
LDEGCVILEAARFPQAACARSDFWEARSIALLRLTRYGPQPFATRRCASAGA